jgi:hypothetical protein
MSGILNIVRDLVVGAAGSFLYDGIKRVPRLAVAVLKKNLRGAYMYKFRCFLNIPLIISILVNKCFVNL